MGELITLPVRQGGELIPHQKLLDRRRRAQGVARHVVTMGPSPELQEACARYFEGVLHYFETGTPPPANLVRRAV